MVLTTAIVSPTLLLFPPARSGQHCLNQRSTPKNVKFQQVSGFKQLGLRLQTNANKSPVLGMRRASVTCSAMSQTVLDNPKVIDRIPTKENKKTPELDNTGGDPPKTGGGGGGGGGGGEGPFYGGFYLFLFLAFVTWLNEEAEKSGYVKNYRKRFQQEQYE